LIEYIRPATVPARVSEPNNNLEQKLVIGFLSITPGTFFTGIHGESIIVVDPGEENFFDGPDIFNATLFINGQHLTGDIECHLSEADWYRHGHASNVRYNNVILHVLLKHKSTNTALNIPTITLPSNFYSVSGQNKLNCRLKFSNEMTNTIELLAESKWQDHVSRFLKIEWKDEKLFEHLIFISFKIIGGHGNATNMELLAKNIFDTNCQLRNSRYLLAKMNEFAKQLAWNSKNVRPFKRKEKIIPLAVELISLINDLRREKYLLPSDMKKILLNKLTKVCGSGTITELLGNVFYPFGSALSLLNKKFSISKSYLIEWKKLKLTYTYSYLDKQFNPYFPRQFLRSFPVLQALKEVESLYCRTKLCKICPLTIIAENNE